jgi:hypothetical protein
MRNVLSDQLSYAHGWEMGIFPKEAAGVIDAMFVP